MAAELPLAPTIPGEAMLEIYVHRSIRLAGLELNPDSAYGNGQRLAALGSKALEAAFAHALFCKKPPMSAEALIVRGACHDAVSHISIHEFYRQSKRGSPNMLIDGSESIGGERKFGTLRKQISVLRR